MPKQIIKTSVTEDYLVRIIGFLISIFLFWLADYLLNFGFEYYHYLMFILICAAGILLSPLYYAFKYYDKVLHFLSPFLFCFLIFFIVDNLDEGMSVKLFLTFAVTVSFIIIVETGEYVIDKLFGWELQGVYIRNRSGTVKLDMIQSKIDDAMQDLIFGIAGCLFFILIKIII